MWNVLRLISSDILRVTTLFPSGPSSSRISVGEYGPVLEALCREAYAIVTDGVQHWPISETDYLKLTGRRKP